MNAFRTAITGLIVTGALLSSTGIAAAADSNDRVTPPTQAEVTMLRSLLALQHPWLRATGPTTASIPASTPVATTEPAASVAGQTRG